MNAVAFYFLAVLIVVTAGSAMALPQVRQSAIAAAAATLMVGLLCLVTGAVALGVIEFLIPVLTGAGLWLALRRSGYLAMLGAEAWPPKAVVAGAGAAGAFAVLTVVVLAASGNAWQSGTSGTQSASLLTVLHYWAPYALVIAAAIAITAAAAALMLGRISDDEREADKAAELRRRREEQAQRRREERLRARGRDPIGGQAP
jgi:hypothetical protein